MMDQAPPPAVHLRVPAAHVVNWHSRRIRHAHDIAIKAIRVNGVELVFADGGEYGDTAFMYGKGLAIRISAPRYGRWTLRASSSRTGPARVVVRYRVVRQPEFAKLT